MAETVEARHRASELRRIVEIPAIAHHDDGRPSPQESCVPPEEIVEAKADSSPATGRVEILGDGTCRERIRPSAEPIGDFFQPRAEVEDPRSAAPAVERVRDGEESGLMVLHGAPDV